MILTTTLCAGAAAAILNIWLGLRIGQLRTTLKISIGDGGSEPLVRRMRAQANFIENAPLVLLLIAAIELARPGDTVLMAIAAIFTVGRVLHGLGMDGGALAAGRMIGTLSTLLVQLALAIWAVKIALGY
ncbi:MAPEG family protein [Novosphingobium sp. Chol11]|uniref:MAPEG family protein n=1 Tax=Novosphingobium sp. Chol11 TaxID=1385763 RepID=UPI0025ED7DEC|nr:MAPEG family protein [Novosphingobium sp. Chol11]